jgi:hypothetical protein
MGARNCLILGSGRSGTSMLAGSLRLAGYYMGAHLIPADETNPKGFFEDDEINAINEALLTPLTPELSVPGYGWRWLASVPVGTGIECPPELASRIEAQTAHAPFCFKDPRFCYTLPTWRPFVADAVFLCVFREPARTAQSILKECREADYLHGLPMDFTGAVAVWTLMYRHVLEVHRHEGEWLFFHYDQLFSEAAVCRLETTLGIAADRQFPDAKLKRTPAAGIVGAEAAQVYEKLIELAQYPGVKGEG